MGQYWLVVNLDKHEFVHPHKLGNGLKLGEQMGSHPGTGAALIALCAAMSERRGGGDLIEDPEIVGRWAGDRIALVGDYAERSDLPPRFNADLIYDLCQEPQEILESAKHWQKCEWTKDTRTKKHYWNKAKRLLAEKPYTDISDKVAAYLEKELGGKFSGDGWREWKSNYDEAKGTVKLSPDLVLTTKK